MFSSSLYNRKEVILSDKDKDDHLLENGLAFVLPNTVPAYATSFALLSQILLLAYVILYPTCGPTLQVSSAVTFYVLHILHILQNAIDCVAML